MNLHGKASALTQNDLQSHRSSCQKIPGPKRFFPRAADYAESADLSRARATFTPAPTRNQRRHLPASWQLTADHGPLTGPHRISTIAFRPGRSRG
jgi:hypothetical protein